ncbi:MAG: DUF3667 domain-containing protein [Verrucomicrobiota bacterium]|nr:DUF3667 domain-containing protein [Chthoniobacterales bacterium]MDQ3414381.1 DUF3667 domain-containing protein [Verrucomicrobiota bacterium]
MSDETSDAIVGDAVVDSLEKPTRKRGRLLRWKQRKEPPPLTHCEDCGEKLHGQYCSKCGQVAVDYRRSFRHVIADVAESFLNWDSKFIQTIGLLVRRPGWLTNQFVAGKRTRFLHPLRLYLLVSIAFFLAARLLPMETPDFGEKEVTPEKRAEVENVMKTVPQIPNDVRAEVRKALAENGAPPARKKPKLIIFDDPEKPKTPFEEWMNQQVKAKLGEDGTKLQFFIETLRSNIPTMMLFCIPLFAFVLKILYLRQGRFYIEHLVYALHIHSFFYLAVLVISFSEMAMKRWLPAWQALTWILWIAVVVQVFLSIRQVYRQSWFMTTFKFFFGGFIYLIVLIAALVVTAVATFALP